MIQLEILAALAIIVGSMILLGVNPVRLIREIAGAYAQRPRTIRRYSNEVKGKHKDNFLVRRIKSANAVLDETGRGDKKDFFQTVSMICAVAGFITGLFTGNGLLDIAFAVIGYLAPSLFVLFTAGNYWRRLNTVMYTGLKLINSTYRAKGIFTNALSTNVDNLSEPLRSAVEQCAVKIQYLNPDRQKSIREMREKINHPVFHQWCDAALRCLDDPGRINELDCIEVLVEDNEIKDQTDANIQNSLVMTVVFMGMAALIIPFLYVTFPELGGLMVTTIPGKVATVILVALIFYALLSIVRAHRPVKLKEGDD